MATPKPFALADGETFDAVVTADDGAVGQNDFAGGFNGHSSLLSV